MHPRVEWSKRSGNIIAIPILCGPHTNMSVYDLRKGQDFAAAHESGIGPIRKWLSVPTTSAFWGTPDSLCEAPGDRQGVEGASPLR